MTKEETSKLFLLLSQFYPNARQLNPDTQLAWELALEEFTYDDVKRNVLRYVAVGKFFPNLSDITADLVKTTTNEDRPKKDLSWMKPYIEKRDAWWREIKERQAKEKQDEH